MFLLRGCWQERTACKKHVPPSNQHFSVGGWCGAAGKADSWFSVVEFEGMWVSGPQTNKKVGNSGVKILCTLKPVE